MHECVEVHFYINLPQNQLAFTLGRPAHVHVELQAWGTYMVLEALRQELTKCVHEGVEVHFYINLTQDQLAFTLGRPAHGHVELQAWGTYMVPEDIRFLGSARNAFSKLWVAEPMNGADIESDRPLPLYHRE